MTTLYNVHLYRVMRLMFAGIEADTPDAAASIARAKPTYEADHIDDCDGEDLGALVDEVGDTDYERSVMIDFECERERKAAAIPEPSARPFVTVTVRGGLVQDVEATAPVTVIVEDWDAFDEDTGQKPTRSVHALPATPPGPKRTIPVI